MYRSIGIATFLIFFGFQATSLQSATGKFVDSRKCDTTIVKKDTMVICSTFYACGKIKDLARYKNGVRHGISESWFENGNIQSILSYDNGCFLDTVKGYHPNGKKRRFEPYSKCKINGDVFSYDSIGTLVGEEHYVNGKIQGIKRFWYPNGILQQIQITDSMGKLDQTSGEYYENGKPKWEAKYDHGKDVSASEYYENNQLALDETYFEDGKRLKTGKYFSPEGKPTGEIKDGNGSYIKCVPNYGCTKFYYENGKKIKTEKVSDADK